MFNKPTYSTNNIQNLENRPQLTPSALKKAFDDGTIDTKAFLEELIDALNSTVDGDSGMDNLGMTPIDGVMNTPQQSLEYLKDRVDATSPTLNIYSLLDNGGITDTQSFDNIPIINSLINLVETAGGGAILIPTGTFYVAPSAINTIKLKSNVTIFSYNGGKLKLKNDVGDFDTLFSGGSIDNVTIANLIIDMNEQNNTTGTQIGFTPIVNLHDTVRCFRTNRLSIIDCKIINSAGVNAITNDGAGVASRTKIVNNDIQFIRGLNSSWYDNTMIRVSNCPNSLISNNYVYADSISVDAECGIDLRSEGGIIENNVFENLTNMCDIVGTGDTDYPSGIIVKNNIGKNIASAFNLWLGDNGLKDVIIRDNIIEIKQKTWDKQGNGVYIIEFNSTTLKMENIQILNNTFTFEDDDRASNFGEAISIGGNHEKNSFKIIGNTVNNSPSTALIFGNGSSGMPTKCVDFEISKNLFKNCCSADNGSKTLIIFKGEIFNTKIYKNFIHDDFLIPKLDFLSGSQLTSVQPDFNIYDNNVYIKNGDVGYSPVPFFANRTLYNLDRLFYSAVGTPTNINVLTNDTVSKDTGLYKITSFGTYGVLTNITGTGTIGEKQMTVNDSSNLKVWNKINIGGVLDTYITKVKGNVVYFFDALPSTVNNGAIRFIAPSETLIS